MRSIRRSLLGYLLLLLALALGAVGALVDRFANGAIQTREQAETKRIDKELEVQQSEAKAKFDADLLAETKTLGVSAHFKTAECIGQSADRGQRGGGGGPARWAEPQPPLKAPDEEGKEYRLRTALMEFVAPPSVLPMVGSLFVLEPRLDRPDSRDPRRYNPFPGWVEYDAPRAVARIGETLRKTFDDDQPNYFQFTLVDMHPGRTGHRTVCDAHSARLGYDLVLDRAWLEPNKDLEPKFDDVEVPGKGKFRRVVTGVGVGGRPISFFVGLPSPPPPVPSKLFFFSIVLPPIPAKSPLPPPFRGPDIHLRVFVHHARPYSELEARLAANEQDRDDKLILVRAETRMELANLRARLTIIGAVTFGALVLGGWFFVARGLAPLRALSDAVSRVSEKDFRLPVEATALGRELAPIHARITQTLTLLQRAFEREKQSVADISHELRTPIASLLATIDVALRRPRTPEQYRTTLEECRLISKQLGQLVERIMTLASLDAGNDHTHITRTDAGELAAGCVAVIRPLAAANNVTVAVHPDEVLVETDPSKLREVLMNLLHNAVEYNQPGGTIELTVRRAGETAVFEVRDTGIGMTADVRERIFERFYRADSSRHATGVHAGLGLAIVKEYVARLNGTITVESEPGAGTTFRVALPATTGAPALSGTRAKSGRDVVPAGS